MKHDLHDFPSLADSDKTIRLKGRLTDGSISDDFEHSILLSSKHSVVVNRLDSQA